MNTNKKVDVQTNDGKHIVIRKLKKDLVAVNVKFLNNIKYKPSIDKYCLADIIRPYNRCPRLWLRLPAVQSFMKKHKEYCVKITATPKHKKEHIFIDYKVIPFVLSWIDISLGFEFQNDLIKTDLSNDGNIYLVQYPSDIKKHIVKVGRAFNIKERYQGKVDVIGLEYVDDMYISENILIKAFEKKFGSPIKGREFFKCPKIEEAIELFYNIYYDDYDDDDYDDNDDDDDYDNDNDNDNDE